MKKLAAWIAIPESVQDSEAQTVVTGILNQHNIMAKCFPYEIRNGKVIFYKKKSAAFLDKIPMILSALFCFMAFVAFLTPCIILFYAIAFTNLYSLYRENFYSLALIPFCGFSVLSSFGLLDLVWTSERNKRPPLIISLFSKSPRLPKQDSRFGLWISLSQENLNTLVQALPKGYDLKTEPMKPIRYCQWYFKWQIYLATVMTACLSMGIFMLWKTDFAKERLFQQILTVTNAPTKKDSWVFYLADSAGRQYEGRLDSLQFDDDRVPADGKVRWSSHANSSGTEFCYVKVPVKDKYRLYLNYSHPQKNTESEKQAITDFMTSSVQTILQETKEP